MQMFITGYKRLDVLSQLYNVLILMGLDFQYRLIKTMVRIAPVAPINIVDCPT